MYINKEKRLFFALVIAMTSLSCGFVDSILCTLTGGKMVEKTYLQGYPYDPTDKGNIRCDKNFDQEKYDTWKNGGSPGEDSSLLEQQSEPEQQPVPDSESEPETIPQPEPAASQHAPFELAEPEDCNAAGNLDMNFSEPEITETSNENKCKYTLTFTNTGNERIWVFLYKHDRFMTGDEVNKWEDYINLDVGESDEYQCDLVKRKSDGAYSFHYLEKIAPIFASDGCKNTFKNNPPPKEEIASPVKVICQ